MFNSSVGDRLEKGQEIGNFALGRSTSLLLFPQNIVKSVLVENETENCYTSIIIHDQVEFFVRLNLETLFKVPIDFFFYLI